MGDVPLRDYIEKVLLEHDKAHAAQHEAVTIAAQELARRLNDLNHAHDQSLADRASFVTKTELTLLLDKLTARIRPTAIFATVATIVALLASLLAIYAFATK